MQYNNYYPNYNYRPVDGYLPPSVGQYRDPVAQPAPAQCILWVQGEAGAKSYLVAPGTSVLLMDSEAERFYIKTMDPSGMPQPLKIYQYSEVNTATQEAPKQPEINFDDKYATRKEYDELRADYDDLMDRLKLAEKKLARTAKGVNKESE